jgi:hypothetical protein
MQHNPPDPNANDVTDTSVGSYERLRQDTTVDLSPPSAADFAAAMAMQEAQELEAAHTDVAQSEAQAAPRRRRRLTPPKLQIPGNLRGQHREVARWWRTEARSDLDRALRSESHFWGKLTLLLALAALFAAVGIRRVSNSSAGLQTAYDLVQVSHQLRDRMERNRALEARITGLKNPNALRREGYDLYNMHAPAPEEAVDLGQEAPEDAP